MYGKTYYFTVFAAKGSRIPIIHANATYTFKKPKPLGLKDAIPAVVNLRAQSGKASFRYKVSGLVRCIFIRQNCMTEKRN